MKFFAFVALFVIVASVAAATPEAKDSKSKQAEDMKQNRAALEQLLSQLDPSLLPVLLELALGGPSALGAPQPSLSNGALSGQALLQLLLQATGQQLQSLKPLLAQLGGNPGQVLAQLESNLNCKLVGQLQQLGQVLGLGKSLIEQACAAQPLVEQANAKLHLLIKLFAGKCCQATPLRKIPQFEKHVKKAADLEKAL